MASDAAAPLAEALQSAAAWAGQATTNLGRPPTSPCWSLVVPTVAVATTILLKEEPRRREEKRPVPGATFYDAMRLRSAVSFILELMCCLLAYAVSYLRRPKGDKDVIAIYCGFGFIPGEKNGWDGNALKRGAGGSEQCAIRLARGLVQRGRKVTVFSGRRRRAIQVEGVTYAPASQFDVRGKYEAIVVWRVPQILLVQAWLGRSLDAKALSFWIHDGSYLALLSAAGATFRSQIRRAVRVADSVVYPSREMRVAQFEALFPSTDAHDGGRDVLAKATVVPHGVPRYFDDVHDGQRRDGWLLWPVSPERGLAELLRMLPSLRNAVKSRGGDFRVVVCHLRGGYHENTKLELPDDVVFAGMLPPKRLAAMLRSCALFVFPSSVPEAFSLATWECALHGVVPVVYGLGALAALGRVVHDRHFNPAKYAGEPERERLYVPGALALGLVNACSGRELHEVMLGYVEEFWAEYADAPRRWASVNTMVAHEHFMLRLPSLDADLAAAIRRLRDTVLQLSLIHI